MESLAALGLVLVLVVACSSHKSADSTPSTTVRAKPPASASHTVLDYLNGDADLSTLATLVRGTDVAKTLAGPGPLTLFAPTNEAFSAQPSTTQGQASQPSSMIDVLNLHVVKKKLTAADLIPLAGSTIDTLGGPVAVAIDGRTLQIGGAPVTRTDILASNGVIHLVGALVAGS
jgi:uncharacterized surface protein with fasciclin (FAS1) repeats